VIDAFERKRFALVVLAALVALVVSAAGSTAQAAQTKPDISTLAGKVAALNGTAGLQIRFSAFIEEASRRHVGTAHQHTHHTVVRPEQPA